MTNPIEAAVDATLDVTAELARVTAERDVLKAKLADVDTHQLAWEAAVDVRRRERDTAEARAEAAEEQLKTRDRLLSTTATKLGEAYAANAALVRFRKAKVELEDSKALSRQLEHRAEILGTDLAMAKLDYEERLEAEVKVEIALRAELAREKEAHALEKRERERNWEERNAARELARVTADELERMRANFSAQVDADYVPRAELVAAQVAESEAWRKRDAELKAHDETRVRHQAELRRVAEAAWDAGHKSGCACEHMPTPDEVGDCAKDRVRDLDAIVRGTR